MDQLVAFERRPARQADEVTRLKARVRGSLQEAGDELVKLREGFGLGVVVRGHDSVFDVAQALAAVVGHDAPPDFFHLV